MKQAGKNEGKKSQKYDTFTGSYDMVSPSQLLQYIQHLISFTLAVAAVVVIICEIVVVVVVVGVVSGVSVLCRCTLIHSPLYN